MTENPDEDDAIESASDSFDLFDDLDPLVTVPRLPCDACESQRHNGLREVDLDGTPYEVCEGCVDHLTNEVEQYHWSDRLTEEHYDRAAEFLRSREEVWCVKDHGYPAGEMYVHTPYCYASVVGDVCDHFGFHIRWFQPIEAAEGEFDCVDEHGPCFEILLEYAHRTGAPIPLEYDIGDRRFYDVDGLDESDALFGRDGRSLGLGADE